MVETSVIWMCMSGSEARRVTAKILIERGDHVPSERHFLLVTVADPLTLHDREANGSYPPVALAR